MNNLKRIRKSRHVTQQQLADRVGVSRTSIHNAECGKLSLDLATKCSVILEENRYTLLGLDAVVGKPNRDEMEIIVEEIKKC